MKMVKSFLVLACIALSTLVCAQSARDIAAVYEDLRYFQSPMALSLKKGTKAADVRRIRNAQLRDVAQQLLADRYDNVYRYARYEAYLSPSALGRQLMIGDGYSKYENMTGIYLPLGQHVVLVDDIPEGTEVNLVIPNWNRRAPEGIEPTKDPAGWGIHKRTFRLQNGVNLIDVKDFDGLAYIDYYLDDPVGVEPIAVHFPGAQVNGYFDISKHDDSDWDALLERAVYPVIDARGKYIQIAYPAADCKRYAGGRGVELISNYDTLVYRQHRLLGLEKYDRVPENRILARVNYNYYMFRDGDGVAYMGTNPGNAMSLVVDPDRVISGDPCWGFSHEVGHVHQLRPQFNWGGLGEVSNNVFSLYVTTSFGNPSRILEQDNYQKARETIIDQRISYLQDDDVFNRLVPFWQLHLYFSRIAGNPDFYPDLFEAFRKQGEREQGNRRQRGGGWSDRGSNPAPYQLNFVKTACEVSQTDLTAFFEQYGFFAVDSFEYDDYGNYRYEMTQEMVDECRAAIAAMNLPKPSADISRLTD